MNTPYFPLPPERLSQAEHQSWLERVEEAEKLGGIREAGIPLVSLETLTLLERYVRGELTLPQVLVLQSQRLRKQ